MSTRAASLGKRVQCELGGKNPIIVLSDADLDLAVAATAKGAFSSTGQRCTATSVHCRSGVHDEFVDRLKAAAGEVVPGNGLNPASTMSPSVDPDQFDKVHEYLGIGHSEGVTTVCGGGRAGEGDLLHGYSAAHGLVGVHRDMRVAREEIFGPVLSVIAVDGIDEALDVAMMWRRAHRSVYTRDVDKVFQYIDRIETECSM